jgi:long-subunit acyl-CoA synthetase (AMP-forming)
MFTLLCATCYLLLLRLPPSPGNPKGVVHTHGSVVAAVESMTDYLEQMKLKVQPNDIYFSFLTLAHIFDRCVIVVIEAVVTPVAMTGGSSRVCTQVHCCWCCC